MTTREQQLDQPAQEVPFGVIQDFNNPQSIQDTVVAAQIVLAVVTAIVVLIRGYSQLRVARKFLLEDYVITLAWVRSNPTPLSQTHRLTQVFSFYTREHSCRSESWPHMHTWELISGT
jgi:hypothetical protein